ncbi:MULTISPECIES: GAP family protein [Paenibacillus]|uniref:GAP family protein n=1 Tax=Paenibacillus TaxID=44249 RepID=UPI00129D6998|nr:MULTISPECIES: GAP family protein [Paenibacillus]MBE7683447.1 hypothetical protein [Paenibacillus sp. P13VS]
MNSELLVYVGGFALLDTLSPTLIGVTLYLMIAENRRFGSRLMIYIMTVMILYFLLGCVLMLGLEILKEVFTSFFENKVVSWFLLIGGGLLFAGSFFIKPSHTKNKNYHTPRSTGVMGLLAMGLTTFLLEAGTALPYYAAVSLMTTEGLITVEWVSILLGYNLVMVSPPIIIYMLYIWLGSSVQKRVERLQNKLEKQSGSVLSWVMCIAGLVLIFNVLDYL